MFAVTKHDAWLLKKDRNCAYLTHQETILALITHSPTLLYFLVSNFAHHSYSKKNAYCCVGFDFRESFNSNSQGYNLLGYVSKHTVQRLIDNIK